MSNNKKNKGEKNLSPTQKAYQVVDVNQEKPISKVYPEIDNDLARDNVENDLTYADLQDL